MEQQGFVDPPNRPMDTSYSPMHGALLHKDYLFVDIDQSERILLGTTNTRSTFWEGSIQTFKNYNAFKSKTCMNYYNSTIIHSGKLLSKSDCVLIAESPAYLRLLNVGHEIGDVKTMLNDCKENMGDVKDISLWEGECKVLTTSNRFLTIWDVYANSGLKKVSDYTDYHTDDVIAACTKYSDENIFASVGLDRRLCIWDSRMDSAASELYVNEFCSLKTVSWSFSSGNIVVVGTEAGDIYMFDVAQPKEFLCVQRCYKSPIHKIVFSNLGNLAVCGDSTEIQIYDCRKNEFDLIYKDNTHEKYVRGLTWCNEELYSCGFDSQICTHTL